MNTKKEFKKTFGLSQNFWHEVKVMVILITIALTVKATLVEIYVVPTGSMEDTILTGDMLIGNKFIYGMRTPTRIGLIWTRLGFDVPWFRLPEFKEVATGDVTIFEFPRDPFQKYVKRCIGIPGSEVMVDSGKIFIDGDLMAFPEEGKYTKNSIFKPDMEQSAIYSYFEGNQDNLSEFTVPYKGMPVDFNAVKDWSSLIALLVQDGNEVSLYDKSFTVVDPMELARMRGFLKYKLLGLFISKNEVQKKQQLDQQKYVKKLIAVNREKNLFNPWEIRIRPEDHDVVYQNLMLNGVPVKDIQDYKVQHDFYFFMGDNRDNSFDSRFWGFVPDYQILGTPVISLVNLFKFKLRFKTSF